MNSIFRFAVLSFVATLPSLAAGQSDIPTERTQFNRDIWVQSGEKTADLSCFNCSIHVRGEVTGDVAAMHGNVTVEPQGKVDGDVAAMLGSIEVENDGRISGDVAAFGGRIRRDAKGLIGGDQASFAVFWVLLMALVPLAILGLIIALIVWLVQRNRQPIPRAA